MGWGRTSEGGTLPGIVQHVNVPILTLQQCRNMKYRASRITANMVRDIKKNTEKKERMMEEIVVSISLSYM